MYRRRKIVQNIQENFNDITRQRDKLLNRVQHTRKEIEKVKQNFMILEQLLPLGIWWCNAKGELQYVSESYLKLRGLTLTDVKNYGWLKFVNKDDELKLLSKWKKCIATGDLWEQYFEFTGTDGVHYSIVSRGAPTRNSQGYIINWIGVYLPILRN